MFRQIIVYVVAIAILLLILGVSGAALYFTLTGAGVAHPPITMVTTTPLEQKTQLLNELPTQTAPPIPSPTSRIRLITAPTTTAILSTTLPSAIPMCGLTSPMNLLYINLGKDGESSSSQAVRMVGINPTDKTIQVISYPCDLWVTTPSLVKDYTISAIRLCSLMQMVKNSPGNKRGNTEIARVIQTALEDTFKVNPDQYLLTTTDSLAKTVDMLKGINYTSTQAGTFSGVNLQKGSNQLDSTAISSLFRAGSQDISPWDLVDRQNNILTAIDQKFIAISGTSLADLIAGSNAVTSISNPDLASLECTLKNIPADQINFSDIIKGNTNTAQDGSINISNLPKILDEMNRLFGLVPTITPTSVSSTTPSTLIGGATPVPATLPAGSGASQTPQSTPTPIVLPTQTSQPTPAQQPTLFLLPTQAPAQSTGALDGNTLVNERCTQCHGLSPVQKKHTVTQWQTILVDMINKGAQLNAAEQTTVFSYLSTAYGQ